MSKTVSEINGQIVGIVSLGDLAMSAGDDSTLASVSKALPNI
jgi:hypothetical protein